MPKITGSIVLATARNFGAVVPLKGIVTVQMLCDNLSGNTTFNLQLSLDKTNWDNAQESGTDISDILVDGAVMIKSFELDPGIYWRILFAGATTGTVAYIYS